MEKLKINLQKKLMSLASIEKKGKSLSANTKILISRSLGKQAYLSALVST
jgi:hypothetical protein